MVISTGSMTESFCKMTFFNENKKSKFGLYKKFSLNFTMWLTDTIFGAFPL